MSQALRGSGVVGRVRRRGMVAAAGVVLALTGADCSSSSGSRCTPAPGPAQGTARGTGSPDGGGCGTVVNVVASINAWGSIAAQLGGTHVKATSIITNPDTDPHDYEPTPADARTLAGAQVAIVNGIGYDPWADKLLAANPVDGRAVLDVGKTVGVADGGNPHRWYNPADVTTVIEAITADYKKADPADAADFDAQKQTFMTTGLAKYTAAIASIKSTYSGTPVGAGESIFAMMSPALGLNLITPPSFLTAISEGTDVSAGDKATIDQQIVSKAIKVYVFNSQNSTPDVAAQVAAAKDTGIPVSAVTETLSPEGASFQDWQTAQLDALAAALKQASGK